MSDMVYKAKKHLIIAQVIGVVFGLIFGLSNGYETFGELLGAVILTPIVFAALLRFCVRAYQFAKVKFGTKIQDSDGYCAVIERPGRGVFAAVIAFFLPFVPVSFLTAASKILLYIYLFVLIVVGAFFCFLDIRYLVKHRHTERNQL